MRKIVSIILLTLFLASGVYVGVKAYSAQAAQVTEVTQETEETTEAAEPAEPEVVEETSEFSEAETTTEPTTEARKVPVGKTATKATAPTEEFVEVSQIAVFSQQEIFVEEPAEEETVTEETTEEATGYEPVYDDPLPPEGEDWIE